MQFKFVPFRPQLKTYYDGLTLSKRHVVFTQPTRKRFARQARLNLELDMSRKIIALWADPNGSLKFYKAWKQTHTGVPSGFSGSALAKVMPLGRYYYIGTRHGRHLFVHETQYTGQHIEE